MKKLLIIPILFICFCGLAQAVDSASIIGRPIKFGNILVAQHDFPKQMDWNDATKVTAALGKGWRLPTQVELNMIYQNLTKNGGFSDGEFWTSTAFDEESAWVQNLTNGGQILNAKEETYYVRAVKTL